jgi:outer membrane protein assembly factor BamD (BamD/ComL family)
MRPDLPPPPADSFVLRADGLVPDKPPEPDTPEANLVGARELFRKGEYSKAEVIFNYLAENQNNNQVLAAEARYFEAESLRLQGEYPKAADTYVRLLNDFPQNPYREQSCQRMYDIANYWLDDTREEMRETREKYEGKRTFVWPRFVSFEKPKPFLDRENRAVSLLEQVRNHDFGPLSDKALFLAGSVRFFEENYRDADFFFSQIHERHPNSPLAAQAVEMAIISKQLSTGGSEYDGRKVAEARKLVDAALRSYPELAERKQEFLTRQMASIAAQQAEKDFKMAEWYRQTKHPGAAYFYYDMVERRYPGSPYAKQANERKAELKSKVVEEQQKAQEAVNPMQPKKSNWWWPFSSDSKDQAQAGPGNAPSGQPNLPGGPEVAPAPRPGR